jgi:hypothetical protein
VPATNPFKPAAGSSPPELIGRQASLDRIRESVVDGPGSPGRVSLFSGARGIGKTVMLNEVEEAYLAAGWLRVSLTATPSMLAQLHGEVSRLLTTQAPPARRRVTGVSVGGVGLDWESAEQAGPVDPADLRHSVEQLLDLLAPDRGLLVTIDEVHGGERDQLREVSALSQHLVRDDRQFALAMAGLPVAVSNLLSDHVLTFLRRSARRRKRALAVDDVEDALRHTVESNGRRLESAAARTAAEATAGYPFMVQLVGYHSWRAGTGTRITAKHVDEGVRTARERLRDLVHLTALNDLSDVDREVLGAMVVDDGPSRVADLATRLGQTRQYINTYRGRLVAAGVIEAPARGKVDFAIPYLRETLREQGGGIS